MKPPAPDALLMAKLLTEWPQSYREAAHEVFFYLIRNNKESLHELGYRETCGIGKLGSLTTDSDRTVKVLKGGDIARVALVFVPDDSSGYGDELGRDIQRHEWEEAQAYLIETGERKWPLNT